MKTMKFEVVICNVDDSVDGDDMAAQMAVCMVSFAPAKDTEVLFNGETDQGDLEFVGRS